MPPLLLIPLNPQAVTPTSSAHFFFFMFTIPFTLLVLLAIVLAKYEFYRLEQTRGRPWVVQSYPSYAGQAGYGTFPGPWDDDVDVEYSEEEDSDEDLSVIEDVVVDEQHSTGAGVVMGEYDSEGLHHRDGAVGAL